MMDPEFYRALRAWRRAALRFLADTPRYFRTDFRRWQRGEDGHFRPQREVLYWDVRRTLELEQLPEFETLREIAGRNSGLTRHLENLVGTPYQARRWALGDIARAFLPTPFLNSDGTVTITQERPIAKLYRDLEDFIVNDSIEARTIWPIAGLTLEQQALTLEPGVLLRRLSDMEVATCIQYGLIRSFPVMKSIVTDDGHGFYGLVLTRAVPKVIGEIEASTRAMEQIELEKRELVEDLKAAAAVLGMRSVGIAGRTEAMDWPADVAMMSMGEPLAEGRWFQPAQHLSRREAVELKTTWRSLRKVGRGANPALHLAARRLSFLSERSRAEDQMLDLMIAAEALYLTEPDGGSQGELSYRLALRAAWWSDEVERRKEVFDLMRKAYGARSDIAHGSVPTAKSLRLGRRHLTLPGLIDESGSIVRKGIRKAIRSAHGEPDGKFRPKWETLIFGRTRS